MILKISPRRWGKTTVTHNRSADQRIPNHHPQAKVCLHHVRVKGYFKPISGDSRLAQTGLQAFQWEQGIALSQSCLSWPICQSRREHREKVKHLLWSGPDGSREHTCLQTSSLQQLMATKDKNGDQNKISQNFHPQRLRSFSKAGTKVQTLQKLINSAPREFAFGRTQIPGHPCFALSKSISCI